jgi:hypothetical protein
LESGPNFPRSYDIAPDDKQFIGVFPVAPASAVSNQIHFVLNWFEELKRRVPV